MTSEITITDSTGSTNTTNLTDSTDPRLPNGTAENNVSESHQPASKPPAAKPPATKTIDLQGVASFAALVELLAQELGTQPGQMRGQLPEGPNSFNQLIGEIDLNSQGYQRKVTLVASPGAPLTVRLQSAWSKGRTQSIEGGVTADFYLGATVEAIMPQGRALARYLEDVQQVLDRMVTLGQSNRLATMSVSASELQAFEATEGANLIRPVTQAADSVFKP